MKIWKGTRKRLTNRPGLWRTWKIEDYCGPGLDNTRLFMSLTAGAGTRCMSLLSSSKRRMLVPGGRWRTIRIWNRMPVISFIIFFGISLACGYCPTVMGLPISFFFFLLSRPQEYIIYWHPLFGSPRNLFLYLPKSVVPRVYNIL